MDVDTLHGPARVHLDEPAEPANLLLVLGHGAGGGVEAPDLLVVRKAAVATGAVVARVEQPYRVAGRRAPAPAHQLDAVWIAVLTHLTARYPGLPVITGGRSSGGRVACRTAKATHAIAVLTLAFPLIPPGRGPDRSRAPELREAGVPVLVVNGDRDAFGVPESDQLVAVHVVAGADHSLRRGLPEVSQVVAAWLTQQRVREQSPSGGVGIDSPFRSEDR